MAIYIALLHYPIYNKRKEVVSTCITGFDLHDIARTACTFGIKKYFVVNPLSAQQKFAERIIDFWSDDASREFNWTRAEAFALISMKHDLDQAIDAITEIEGKKPKVVATSAKSKGSVSYQALRKEIEEDEGSILLVFGTGWGIADEIFDKFDQVLPPIIGKTEYNHLSVRSACAIILDRLLGE